MNFLSHTDLYKEKRRRLNRLDEETLALTKKLEMYIFHLSDFNFCRNIFFLWPQSSFCSYSY